MNLVDFVAESNRIEGILRPPTLEEIKATEDFVTGSVPTVESLCALALIYTNRRGKLRDHLGLNVRVGNHVAPKGGEEIGTALRELLATIEFADPYEFHVAYETLHPFLDGNGRTGRALWAWQVWHSQIEYLDLGFLHAWYYMSLSANRR